jgi:uncharacterized protein HemY
MSFLRMFIVFIIVYFLIKSLRNLFKTNSKKPQQWGKGKSGNSAGYYKDITDQKIEDVEYEDVETENGK